MYQIILSLIFFFSMSCAIASEYPQTRLEQETESMGSLIEDTAIRFRTNKEKSNVTKAKIGNVNKFLYQASIDILKEIPLASVDSHGGVIITEWFTPAEEQKNRQRKITVYIQGDIITPESLEVIVFQKDKKNNKWRTPCKLQSVASETEDKILRKARDLYLESKK